MSSAEAGPMASGRSENRAGPSEHRTGTVKIPQSAMPAPNRALQQVALAEEVRDVNGTRPGVNFPRRSALLDSSAMQKYDTIGNSQSFALVVGHKEKGDAKFPLKFLEFTLHLDAQVGVERGERLIEQQNLRPVDQRARQRHALLLPSADLPRIVRGERFHPNFS